MKTYTFRLGPVLKFRKLKEETCRIELGRLITELTKIDTQLAYDHGEIESYYKIQEGAMKTGIRGDQIQAFPMLVAGKERNIQLLVRDKKIQEEKIEIKRQELAILRGELKVIENLKEKDYNEYRKAMNKEIDLKVEEQTQNWLAHKERKV
jgi:flagellar export protein FliJ